MANRACIISLTPVTDEPRVLRQAQALIEAGWEVTVAGLQGRQPAPSSWRFIPVQNFNPRDGVSDTFITNLKHRAAGWSLKAAEDYYWRSAGYDGVYEQLASIEQVKCDVAIAHDYFTVPIAAKLAKKSEGKYLVDFHEYASEQYMHNPKWIKRQRPWIHSLQKKFLSDAALVTTICDGIADLIAKDYRLKRPPVVVRSVSSYAKSEFRATGTPIEVLYHGNVFPMRGLECAIRSVVYWRPEFVFVIRGPASDEYRNSLLALAAEQGVSDRVKLEPPVLFNEMIPTANRSDIGFFVQEDISAQKRFTLPNKLFEYIMAGLALCVADLPEMAKIVKNYDLGLLVQGADPKQIADAINRFTPQSIDELKRRSLLAARELCWESEAEVMLRAYNEALN